MDGECEGGCVWAVKRQIRMNGQAKTKGKQRIENDKKRERERESRRRADWLCN
jgi:hypothetical protein